MARYAVGELARLSGVTVRTLHHYDRIGLLTPTERSRAGHRRYTASDAARWRQILYYRELGFALPEIRAVLSGSPVGEHLRNQHRLLRHRRRRIETLLAAVDDEIHAHRLGVALTPEQQLAIFGTDRFTDVFTEAATTEAHRRGATYTAEDWAEIKAEAAVTIDAFADAIRSGEPANSERAMRAAEAHRAHLERWLPADDDRARAGPRPDAAHGFETHGHAPLARRTTERAMAWVARTIVTARR